MKFKKVVIVDALILVEELGLEVEDICWETSHGKVIEIEVDTKFLDMVLQGKDAVDYLTDSLHYRIQAHLFNKNNMVYHCDSIMVEFS